MTARTLDIDQVVLASGAHKAPKGAPKLDGGMCIVEAAAYVAGEPWSDHPACVSPVIAGFLRGWNDRLDDVRRQELRRWIVPIIGTALTPDVETLRAWVAADWAVRTHTPIWLRRCGLHDHADALAALAEITPDTHRAAMPTIDAAANAARALRERQRPAARAAFEKAFKEKAAWAAWAAGAAEAAEAAWAAWAAGAAGTAEVAGTAGAAGKDWYTAVRQVARERTRALLADTIDESMAAGHELVARLIAVGQP